MVTSTQLPWTRFRRLAVMPVIALGILSMVGCGGQAREDLDDATITLSASAISPNEIALSWTEAAFLLVGEDYEVFMNGAFLFATETTRAVASGLMPDTRYCFQIQIDTLIGSTPVREHSDMACATTLPAT